MHEDEVANCLLLILFRSLHPKLVLGQLDDPREGTSTECTN